VLLLVLSLVATSCEEEQEGGKVTEEDKGQVITTGKDTDEDKEVIGDKIKYGGQEEQ